MRILVTGSRGWQDWGVLAKALTKAAGTRHPSTITVVHGGARGADTMAGIEASTRGWKTEVHEADWDKHGRAAGILRNLEMVQAGADICLAFIYKHSRGAVHCANTAEQAGIRVIRYYDNGDGEGVIEPRGDSPDHPPARVAGVPGPGGEDIAHDASADCAGRVPDYPVIVFGPGGSAHIEKLSEYCGKREAARPLQKFPIIAY